jgi:hypothetical protein
VEYWKESLEIDGDQSVPFEIELFYRKDIEKQRLAIAAIEKAVSNLNGHIIKPCLISEIQYHSLLVEMPRAAVESLVSNYESIALAQVDDIMFFRPTCQSVYVLPEDSESFVAEYEISDLVYGDPVIAIFDGMPLQNHPLLSNRIIVDDPDDYQNGYQSKCRAHGTAMASLVIYGDLNGNDVALDRPIYFRPVMKPSVGFNGESEEVVPRNELFLDVIHRAVKRMFDGEGDQPPLSPSVKVINFSIGDAARQFSSTMSPLARLLDYLSYKYKVLFVISAGNHRDEILKIPLSFSEFSKLAISERNSLVFSTLNDDIRNIKVLSPAESINCLTVGALYQDFSTVAETNRFIFAVENGMPSPVSSFGMGYRRIISPDLFYYGGRKYLRENQDGNLFWVMSAKQPGCKVAAPYGDGTESGQAYSFGTSDAAAQLTHEAGKCFNTLNEIFKTEARAPIPEKHAAILIKAMLAHGASWDVIADRLAVATSGSAKQLAKWLGNGIPNIERVEGCAKNRVTLIGKGELKIDEGHVFHLPLPIDFSSKQIKRRLTVTLAYFSPVEASRQLYRSTQMWFSIDDEKGLVPDRQNTDWQSVRRV